MFKDEEIDNYDGYEHDHHVHVNHATHSNQRVIQKHSGITMDDYESDEDDYTDDNEYPSDKNIHRFPLHLWVDKIPAEEYKLFSNSLEFICGPAPFENNEGHVHQKKSYKICIKVPPHLFSTENMNGIIANEWKLHPDKFDEQRIPVFNWVIILYLGSISRIIRSFQPAIQTASKNWFQQIVPSNKASYYYFDVTFTNITTNKLKHIPFRLHAQLSVESSFSPGVFTLKAAGQSLMFSIYSHSQQYGYTRTTHCTFCGHNKTNETLPTPKGFKKRDGSRKLYLSKEHQLPAWKKEYDQKKRKMDEISSGLTKESSENTLETFDLCNLKIHSIFPVNVCPGESIIIFLQGGNGFPNISHIYIFLDGEQSVLEFARIKMDDHAFSGQIPYFTQTAENIGKKKYFIRRVGFTLDEMVDVPENFNTYFCYKTREEILSSYELFL